MAGAACAQTDEPRSAWRIEKCQRYTQAWQAYVTRRGTSGLSAEFLAAHEKFLTSDCENGGTVCPRTAEELDAANVMVIQSMNAGAASTFAPFGCKR